MLLEMFASRNGVTCDTWNWRDHEQGHN